ncbi:MAG: lactate racemase domain-containing protein [Thermoguttaceae bacterium]
MASVLRYGPDSSVKLEFAEGVLLAECGRPPETACPPSAAVAETLSNPLDYPPLQQSIVAGDHVVVALESGVPQASEVVGVVVQTLVASGIAPDGITVLRTQVDAEAGIGDPAPWLDPEVRKQITMVTHDPTDRQAMAYLAATESGEPILLNRVLTDADIVLPVGCIQARPAGSFRNVASHVFPSFSNQRTLLRFRAVESRTAQAAQRKQLAEEVRQVGWLLGLTFTLQIVPGPGDRILHALAGEYSAVRRRARELYEAAWRCSVPRRARLVVAGIEGGHAQQTWHNVGRAAAAAGALVEDGGVIAICCDVASEPGPAVQRLATASSREEALRQIRKEHPADALTAAQLAQVLRRAKVYLLSRVNETLLEDLEIAPITESEDLVRLTKRFDSCILLANAPRTMATAEE